jgi:hypothetical protein
MEGSGFTLISCTSWDEGGISGFAQETITSYFEAMFQFSFTDKFFGFGGTVMFQT